MLDFIKKIFSSNKEPEKEIIKVKKPEVTTATYKNKVITITHVDGNTEQYKYTGIWHKLPDFDELSILDLKYKQLQKIKNYVEHYGNPYPLAHLKNEKE